MVNLDTLESDLKTFLVEQLFVDLPVEDIRNDMVLGREVGVDSLGFTEILAYLEDRYAIKVSDQEFTPENFRTLEAIMTLTRSKEVVVAA